jgi:serine phosphatase RsbU (regulator of sigma subunit)
LGQFPDWRYEQSDMPIGSGDTLLIFTDGLVEACNADQEWFGEQSLIRIVHQNLSSSARDLMGLILGAASQHCGQTFQDDASMIVLKGT